MPYALVQGNLTYDGKSHQIQGTGYHDRQWGNINWNRDIDRLYWSTGHYGNYTIDIGQQVTSADYNHQQLSTMYLARGNHVLHDVMKGVSVQTSENITDPSGAHSYPKVRGQLQNWYVGSHQLAATIYRYHQFISPLTKSMTSIESIIIYMYSLFEW